jgi:Protein of unknown function (DUF1236)
MTNRLMISVAAIALIAGTGFANAQGTNGRESGGAAVQQGAPAAAGGGAMQNRESSEPSTAAPSGSSPGKKSTQSDQKSPTAPKNQRAEDNMTGPKSKGVSSDNETKGPAKDMKAEGREGRDNNMKAEGREGRDNNMKAEGREDRNNKNAETKSPTERSQTTVGVAGGGAKLSTEQRTRITTVIRNQHAAPLNSVNFTIAVGTRVPRDVTFYPLPTEIVTFYPEWRGYEYILVGDQILVINPRSQEIVAVLDV